MKNVAEKGTRQQDVAKLYESQCSFDCSNAPFYALTPTQVLALGPKILTVDVPVDMPLRRVWPFFFLNSASVSWFGNYDLCASLKGQEVYRQKVMNLKTTWDSSGNTDAWISNHSGLTGYAPITECVRYSTPAGTVWMVCPWYWNLTCDQIYIEVQSISGASSWCGRICVLSERGI